MSILPSFSFNNSSQNHDDICKCWDCKNKRLKAARGQGVGVPLNQETFKSQDELTLPTVKERGDLPADDE